MSSDRRQGHPRALVTGASRGLGRALTHVLASQGVDVLAVGRDTAALDETARLASGPGVVRTVAVLDLHRESLELALDELTLDYAFACAGEAVRADVLDTDESTLRRLLETNVVGVHATIRVASARMNRGGRIIVIGSTASVTALAGLGSYVASKHAVLGLSRTATLELAERGIQVTTVLPGPIRTTILDQEPTQAYMTAPDAAATIVACIRGVAPSAHLTQLQLEPWESRA